MSIIETPRFPDDIAFWAVGGRAFKTSIVRTSSGHEYRNEEWAEPLGEWEVPEVFRSPDWQAATYNQRDSLKIFMACHGQGMGFRIKDFMEFKDDGGGILGVTGLAVASTLTYQMFKGYSVTPASLLDTIKKPVAATIKVFKQGVLQTLTTNYTLDSTTGAVTFTSQPTIGNTLTWTGEFDRPVRFGTDQPTFGFDSSGALISWSGLRFVELRAP